MTRHTNHNQPTTTGDDHVLPFQVDELDLRGRAVQLGPMLNDILERHAYPDPVAELLAQVICLGILLGSSLKFEGRFTIQTQTDGPVSLLVVDYHTPDAVRAYARFDEQALRQCTAKGQCEAPALLGKGVMAMTIDQGNNSQRYQGIVALDGSTLEDVAHQYFRQSEQIPTKARLAVAKLIDNTKDGTTKTSWRAGGLLAQFLPQAPERMKMPDFPGGDEGTDDAAATGPQPDDVWLEASSLVSTIADDELTDPQIDTHKLLYRLFHQQGVKIYPTDHVSAKCSCSRQKIAAVIDTFSQEELAHALAASEKPGTIMSKCEFCGRTYEFDNDPSISDPD